MPDGNYEVTFRIFDAETSGTELWEEKQNIAVDNGVVSANLGSVTEFPSSLDFNSAIWLEIQVNGDAPMTPRRKVLAVPSALNADTVDGFHASQTPTANQIPVVNSSGTLALTGGVTVGSHILPSASGSINLGSSSAKFGTIYADTISADSTTISGTDSTAFTINTGQTTNNTDNAQVKFYLGPTLNDHAALQWSGSTNRFELYSRLASNTLADLRVASITASDSLTSAGTLAVTGAATLSSTLNVTGTTTLATLNVSGDATFDSNTLFVDATNNFIGIGTTSPAAKLHVVTGGDSVSIQLSHDDTDQTRNLASVTATHYTNAEEPVGLVFADILQTANQVNIGGGRSTLNAATQIGFFTGATTTTTTGSERARITSDGFFGIGDLSPAALLTVGTNDAFQVTSAGNVSTSGTLSVTGAATLSSTLGVTGATTLSSTLNVSGNTTIGSNSLFVNTSTGRVGIGTTSPQQLLEVSSASDARILVRSTTEAVAGTTTLQFMTGSGAASSANTTAWIQSSITQADPSALKGNLIFSTNRGDALTEAMRIDDTGSVGIGITSPSYKLEVFGSGNDTTSGSIRVRNNTAGTSAAALVNVVSDTASGYIGAFSGSHSNGNMSDRFAISANSDASGIVLYAPGASQDIRMHTGGTTERVRIDTTGNVGIGDTSPAALLTVGTSDAFQVTSAGNISTSGTLAVTGSTTLSGSLSAAGTSVTTLSVSSAASLSSTLAVTGATTLSSTLGVTGATTFSSTLNVTGNSSAGDTDITLGDASTDEIIINASLAQALVPTGNGTINLGTASNRFGTIYADTINYTNSESLSTISNSLTINSDAADDEDSYLEFYRGGSLTSAKLYWDATNDRFYTNFDYLVQGNTTLGNAATDTTTVRGALTLSDSDSTYKMLFGSATQPGLYRSATNTLALDGNLQIDASGTSDGTTTTHDSRSLTFNGNYWNGSASTEVTGGILLDVTGTTPNYGLALQTGGTTHGYLDQTGRLGLGTTDPQAKLHIAGTGNTDIYLMSGATYSPRLVLGETTNTGSWGAVRWNGSSNTIDLMHSGYSTSTAALTVNSSGTVSAAAALSVTGATTLSSTLGVTGATTLSSTLGVTGATTLSSTLGVTGATTLNSTLAVTGNASFSANVGIGGAATTDPLTIYTPSGDDGFALQINDPLTGTHGGIDFYNDTGGTAIYLAANASYQQSVGLTVINSAKPASLISLNSRTTGDIDFYAANVAGSLINTMRIVGGGIYAGSVVIGESSSTSLANAPGWGKVLQIQDGSHVALSLRDTGTSDQIDLAADNGTFRIYDVGDSAYRMWVDTNGLVSFGDITGIAAKLQVNADTVAEALRLKSNHDSYTYASLYNATGTKWDILVNNNGLTSTYGAEGDLNLMRSGGARISLGKSGGVGIGNNANANHALNVLQSGHTTSTSYGMSITNNAQNATTDLISKYGLYISSVGTFTGSTGGVTRNYGLYVDTPSGADANHAAYFRGTVGFGSANGPTRPVDIYSTQYGTTLYASNAIASGTAYGAEIYAGGAATTNIAMYLSATNATNNYGLVVANGNVGIGDTSPAALLTVGTSDAFQIDSSGNVSTAGTLAVTGATTLSSTLVVSGNVGLSGVTPGGQLSFSAAESNTPAIRFQNSHSSTSDAVISSYDTASGTELYLGSNWYVPASGSATRLNTSGASSALGLLAGSIQMRTGGTGANPSTTFQLDSSGNAAFHSSILSSTAGWSKILSVHHDTHAAISISDSGQKFDWGVDANKLWLYDDTDDVYRMVVDTDGNVGVGTTSPTALLHLSGNRSAASWTTNGLQLQVAAATLTDTTGSGTIANRVANSFGVPTFASSNATTITTAATFYIAGAPLAGTNTTITNAYAMDVSGDIRLRSGNDPTLIISHVAGSGTTFTSNRQINLSAGAEMTFTTDVDNGDGAQRVFTFKGGVANYMTLDRGNLAIGTTTPSARLHVQAVTANFSASSWLTNGVGLRIDGVTYINNSTGAGGTVATAVINSFGQPTIQSSSATVTTTHASNVYIAGVPQAGSNQTLTSSSALRIASSAATAGTTNAYSLYVDAPTTATNNYAGYFGGSVVAAMGSYTLNGVTNGAQVFNSSGNAALVARGGTSGTLTIPTAPTSGSLLSSSSVGEVGIVGAATTSAGARTNIGIYGYSYLDQPIASNGSNKAFGGVFIGALGSTTGSSAAMAGQTVGIYAKGDSSAASASAGSTYGVFGWAAGISGETTYGVYGNATGGTTNYDLFADNTSGATIALRRYDIAATASEVIGALSFINNDSQLTTQQSYGKIEVQAAQTISTDAAAGNMLFYTTGISVGGSPTERMRIRHDGNVGIGATNPGSLLTLSGAAGTTMGISLGTNTDNITASRYIGITNSTDHTNLAVNQGFSGIEFGGPSSTDEGYVAIHTHDAGNASGERLRIDKSGNVGIATGATVGGKLHVNADSIGGTYGMVMTANGLTTGRALQISSNSTAGGASGASYMAVFERSGANANTAHTAYGVYSTVTNTNATSGTNVAGYFSASGATTANYGLIVANGNTGFGTTGPESKVQISGGGLCVGSDADCNTDNNTEGVIYASSTNTTVYDVAENYPTKDKTLTATEIVELDPSNSVFVRRATGTNNHKLLGIISEEPGLLLGGFNGNQFRNERQVAVALSGRVRVKMDPASPAVAIGDPLTASTKAGYATKATGSGTIIGRALEPWVPGSGQQLVMTFVQTQYYNPAYEPNFAEELQTTKVIAQTIESPAGKNLVINTQQMVVNGRLVVNEAVTVSKTFVTPPSETQKISASGQIQANATKIKVAGDGGAVSLTSTPIIGDAADGQLLIIQGTEDANTVTVKDQSVLDGSNLELGAETRVLGKGDILTLTFDASDSVWYEVSYTDN